MEEKFQKLQLWLVAQIEASRRDMSGTNDYHCGLESAYDSVLEWIEEELR